MARRIDIELTSARPDGTWTWRAAGALQPRGILDGQLLHPEARAGDVLRAEADFEIEGISINSVLAPKEKKRSQPERIELLAPATPTGGVTTQLAGRGERRPSEARRTGREGGRDAGRGGEARTGRGRTPGERTSREPTTGGRPATRPARAPGDSAGPPAERPSGDRQAGDRSRRRQPGSDNREARPRPERAASAPAETGNRAPAGRRLNPGNAHRQEVMASLPPEQQPIAEQVLRGGIPAVRTALHLEREKATAEGRPAPNSDSLLAIAEELLPRLKAAEWRDRAEAAAKVSDDLSLRDLRSVVAGGDLARDDETRALAASLREILEARLTALREDWVRDITTQLDEGRVVRALRLAARPPDATTRLSAEQSERLREAAGSALSPDTTPDRWIALLEAVAASPVRRSVTPVGLPAEPGAALLSAAQQQVGRIPSLAGLLGISMPPPPGPTRAAPGGRPPRRQPAGGGRPIPPRPSPATPPPAATGPAPAGPASSTEPAPLHDPPATHEPALPDEPTAAGPAPLDEPAVEQTGPAVEETGSTVHEIVPTAHEIVPTVEEIVSKAEPEALVPARVVAELVPTPGDGPVDASVDVQADQDTTGS